MTEVTSVNNELVKEVAKLQQTKFRNESGKFILEGFKVIREAYDSGIKIECVFVKKGAEKEYSFLNDKLIITNEAVLKKISSTQSPPVAVAVGVQKRWDNSDFKNSKKVVLLENIKDAGNLGTILRTAAAFGADGIVLYGKEIVDLYNPKTVRSAVGNLWKTPILIVESICELKEMFNDYERIATLPLSKNLLAEFKSNGKLLLMFGSEADGLSDELIKFSTKSVKIEMSDNVESLNLSVSCAVCMYELF